MISGNLRTSGNEIKKKPSVGEYHREKSEIEELHQKIRTRRIEAEKSKHQGKNINQDKS